MHRLKITSKWETKVCKQIFLCIFHTLIVLSIEAEMTHPLFNCLISFTSLLCPIKVNSQIFFSKFHTFIDLFQEPEPLINLPSFKSKIQKTGLSCPYKVYIPILFH